VKFRGFNISNFKGIREAEIRFSPTDDARVYTLVGLNESGKTTLLEAIHSFSPDGDTEIVVGNVATAQQQRQQRVPRHRISDFTGRVSVVATIKFDEGDKEALGRKLADQGIRLDIGSLTDEFTYERYQQYKNGDYVGNYYETSLSVRVKSGKQRKFRNPTPDESGTFALAMRSMMPAIAYFPTFVFDFPEKIYLSNRNDDKTNAFYRSLFQDILDYADRGHTIEEHITNRVQKDSFQMDWSGFFPKFKRSTEHEQIDHVIDLASRTVTQVVYKKWNEIFNEDTGTKEIQITWDVEKGLMQELEDGTEAEPSEHDIFIGFRVKDGTDRFPINTRSLGFRWFFSFLLFTQFRAVRDSNRPLVFLFDEPASNLHAAAQQKLIESFAEIARPPHVMIYSTHSHYMVEPKWLEQAYIIHNDISASTDRVIDSALLDDASVDVKATQYRRYVERDDSHVSYFQPILDRLEVVPSKFDIEKGGIIVEGKSDYYILRYLQDQYEGKEHIPLFPALGAGTMGAMIGLMKGWGLPVRIVLDSDKTGLAEKAKYQEQFFLSDSEIVTLTDLLSGMKTIESLLNDTDKSELQKLTGKATKLSKKDILIMFQEKLSSGGKIKLSGETVVRAKSILKALWDFAK